MLLLLICRLRGTLRKFWNEKGIFTSDLSACGLRIGSLRLFPNHILHQLLPHRTFVLLHLLPFQRRPLKRMLKLLRVRRLRHHVESIFQVGVEVHLLVRYGGTACE